MLVTGIAPLEVDDPVEAVRLQSEEALLDHRHGFPFVLGEWARIGSAGRLVSCRFASEREAALAMAEHLKAKLSKGYEAV